MVLVRHSARLAGREDGTGLLNTVTLTVPGVIVPATDVACGEVSDPNLSVTKSVASGPVLNDDGTYTIRYTVTVGNDGEGPGLYDLVDEPTFGPAIQIVSATVSSISLTFIAGIDPVSLNGTFGTCTGSHQGSESEFFNTVEVEIGDEVVDSDDACVPPSTPNLVITKSVSPDPLVPSAGGVYDVIYTITVSNTGDGPTTYTLTDSFAFADGVEVLDVEVVEKPGSATLIPGFNGSSRIRVATAPLPAKTSHAYRIAVQVDASGVRSEEAFDCELDPGENGTGLLNRATVDPTAEASVEIPKFADLVLSKVVDKSEVDIGSNVTFTIYVTNTGPAATSGVTVKDALPAGLKYVSQSGDGSYNASTGIWTIGDIAVGQAATLSLTVKVEAEATITNVAQVWTSAMPDPDSTPGNNVPSEDDQDDAVVRGRPIVVIEPPAPPPATLPPTGSESRTPITTAFWLVLVGAILVAWSARSRGHVAEPGG